MDSDPTMVNGFNAVLAQWRATLAKLNEKDSPNPALKALLAEWNSIAKEYEG